MENVQTLEHLESCQNHTPHVQSLVHRRQKSVRPKLAQLVVDYITLLDFVLISACCVAKLSIVHQNVSTKKRLLQGHLASVHLVPTLWAVPCSVPCYGATVDDTEEDQDANDIENFAAFSIESLEGFATPVGGAMKAVSGFTSVESLLSCHLQLSNHRMCITAMGLGCLHWLAHTAGHGHVQSVSSYWHTVSFAWAVHTEERKWR